MKELINKYVKLVFEDGSKSQIREGKVLDIKEGFLKLSSKNRTEILPLNRIVRIQVKGGGD